MIRRNLSTIFVLGILATAAPQSVGAQDSTSANLCGPLPPAPVPANLKMNDLTAQQMAIAINQGDFATALRVLRPLAESGNAQAQFNLGTMYDAGQGLTVDPEQATHWYRLSADQGYPNAEYNLAANLANGIGTTQDYAEAALWTRKAADSGVAMAQFGPARLYLEGHALAKDNGQALAWALKAADQGLAEAQFTVAILYAEGAPGSPTDHAQALMWADLSLQRFTAKEAARRQIAQRDRDLMFVHLSPASRSRAVTLENQWLASHRPCAGS